MHKNIKFVEREIGRFSVLEVIRIFWGEIRIFTAGDIILLVQCISGPPIVRDLKCSEYSDQEAPSTD